MSITIRVQELALAHNQEDAGKNRTLFKQHGLRVINMISSPGSGKTTLLEKMGIRFKDKLAVITGDLETSLDAERLEKSGCRAIQIETGEACHLSAKMITLALTRLDLTTLDLLVIENVGNLVCPAAFDLGETQKVALLSVAEGDEKPLKYPSLFVRASAIVLTKIDLLPYVNFNVEKVKSDCRKLNASARFIPVSCKTGEGMEGWFDYVQEIKKE